MTLDLQAAYVIFIAAVSAMAWSQPKQYAIIHNMLCVSLVMLMVAAGFFNLGAHLSYESILKQHGRAYRAEVDALLVSFGDILCLFAVLLWFIILPYIRNLAFDAVSHKQKK